jgi:hypothetical protein
LLALTHSFATKLMCAVQPQLYGRQHFVAVLVVKRQWSSTCVLGGHIEGDLVLAAVIVSCLSLSLTGLRRCARKAMKAAYAVISHKSPTHTHFLLSFPHALPAHNHTADKRG